MFSRLPESNAQRQKRGGGFVLSTAAHVVLIAFAIRATALTAMPPEGPSVVPIEVYRPPEPPRTPAPPSPRTNQAPTSGPALPAVTPPPQIDWSKIPDTIPEPGAISTEAIERLFERSESGVSGGRDNGPPNAASGQPLEERFVDRPVVALPGTASPRYPAMLQGAGVEGEVRAQFVVDTLGRVEQESVRILESTHASFAQAVRDALTRARFVPAEARGRKVRQLVEQPFNFKLTGR